MKNKRDHSDQFIVQNFRSWHGKNYIKLNEINFLFGANSSGKSSIIKAIGLLEQSLTTRAEVKGGIPIGISDRFIDRLKPNGENVHLGQIQHQLSRVTEDKSSKNSRRKKDSEALAFGYKWRKFVGPTQFDTHEILARFSDKDGSLTGIDILVDDFLLLKIQKTSETLFTLTFCADEDFWQPLFELFTQQNKSSTQYFHDLWNTEDRRVKHSPVFRNQRNTLNYLLEEMLERYNWTKDLLGMPPNERASFIERAEIDDPFFGRFTKYDDKELDEAIEEIDLQCQNEFGINIYASDAEVAEAIDRKILETLPDFRKWDRFKDLMQEIRANSVIELEVSPNQINRIGPSLRGKMSDLNPVDIIQFIKSGRLNFKNHDVSSKPLLIMLLISMFFFPRYQGVFEITERMIGRFRARLRRTIQIGPYRKPPERVSVIDPHLRTQQIGYSAENMLNILHHSSSEVKTEINNWLEALELGYHLETEFHEQYDIQEIVLKDQSGLKVSILDVGFGVSQILPIIIQAITVTNTLITIEQPELHIHPRLQANLAELFIWSAKHRNNQFLIETHSEHIILRLQRLQREKNQDNVDDKKGIDIYRDISINVVEKIGLPERSAISELKINSKGEFNGEWPGGFFEERYVEKGII